MEITRVGSQSSAKGPSDWFTGTVRIAQCELIRCFNAKSQHESEEPS